jgi:hypothetical protein
MQQFEMKLNDEGKEGDGTGSDNVFSVKVPEMEFGFYRLVVEATDSFRNTVVEEAPLKILLH